MPTKTQTAKAAPKATNGAITHIDPTASPKAQVAKATAANARNATLIANAAKTKAAEAEAKASNAKALAARASKPKATPILDTRASKGSGALVGVAQGAMDGQPHTKLAVEQARKRFAAEAKATIRDIAGNVLTADKIKPALVVGQTQFPNATRANDARRAIERAATAKAAQGDAPKAAKAKRSKGGGTTTRAVRAGSSQSITILNKGFAFGREGSARRDSWNACLASKTSAEYVAKGGAAKYLPRWVAAGAIALA